MPLRDKQGNIDLDSVSPAVEHTLRQYNPYMIVHCDTPLELVTEVNDNVLKGYTPKGGVMYDGTNYYHAMLYISPQPITRRFQSRSVHSKPDGGDGDERRVHKAGAKRSTKSKRSVSSND